MDRTETKEIGRRLKAFRQERGWTLERLSQTSGVSPSNISKMEKGTVAPAFDTLLRVAKSLGASLEDLLAAEPAGPLGRRTITRRGDAIPFANEMYDYLVHAADLRTKRMIPLDMRIKAREVPDPAAWSSHEGEEFIYVVAGAIELHTEHYAPQRLVEGESAYIDSAMRHAFVSVGEGDAHVLSICFSRGLPLEDAIAGMR